MFYNPTSLDEIEMKLKENLNTFAASGCQRLSLVSLSNLPIIWIFVTHFVFALERFVETTLAIWTNEDMIQHWIIESFYLIINIWMHILYSYKISFFVNFQEAKKAINKH